MLSSNWRVIYVNHNPGVIPWNNIYRKYTMYTQAVISTYRITMPYCSISWWSAFAKISWACWWVASVRVCHWLVVLFPAGSSSNKARYLSWTFFLCLAVLRVQHLQNAKQETNGVWKAALDIPFVALANKQVPTRCKRTINNLVR